MIRDRSPEPAPPTLNNDFSSLSAPPAVQMVCFPHILSVTTSKPLEFIDLTEPIQRLVQRNRIEFGHVNVQTRHTTTGLIVNENEPLLLEDFARHLEQFAGTGAPYRHDLLELRTQIPPYERRNGHAHCKALALRTSETVNICGGRLHLGTWQRILFLELDTASVRSVSLMFIGSLRAEGESGTRENNH